MADAVAETPSSPLTPEAGRARAPALEFDMSRVGKHTLIYGLGILLNRAVGLIMLPIYTRFLSPSDYGVMELIGMTLEIIAILAGAQLAVGVFRYYHKAETDVDRNAVVSTALFTLGASYAVIGTLAFVSAAWLSTLVFGDPQHAPLFRIAAIGFALNCLITVPLAYARVRDRSTLFVAANAVKLAIGVSLNLLLVVYLREGVRGVLISNAVATGVVGVWLTIWVLRQVGGHVSRRAALDLMRYGIPLMFTWAAAFIATYGDRYFLQKAGDSAVVGLYSLAYQFGFLLIVLGQVPFMQVWEAKRFEIAKREDRHEVLARGFVLLNVLLFTVAVGITLFVGDFLRIMATPAFYAAARLVPIVLVAYLIQAWTSVHEMGILVRERTEYLSLASWIGAGVAFAGYAVLIPRWLGWGAAIATVIAFAIRGMVVYALSQRLWYVRYEWTPIVKLALLAVTTGVVGYALPQTDIGISILVRLALFSAFVVAVWHARVLSIADREMVRQLGRSMRRMIAARRLARAPQGA